MTKHRKHKKLKYSSHTSKAAAQAKAKRLRAQGHRVRVHRDSSGRWIVDLIVTVAAINLLGQILRPR